MADNIQQTQMTRLQTTLPPSFLSNEAQQKLAMALQKMPTGFNEQFFRRYTQPPSTINKAVSVRAPTFHDVARKWGDSPVRLWVRFHVASTFAFLGVVTGISRYQLNEMSRIITTDEIFGQMSVSEFLYFLERYKTGEYGKIFSANHPNPQEFFNSMRHFWTDLQEARRIEIQKEERLARERKLNNADNMTRSEWEEIKMIQAMYEMDIKRKE